MNAGKLLGLILDLIMGSAPAEAAPPLHQAAPMLELERRLKVADVVVLVTLLDGRVTERELLQIESALEDAYGERPRHADVMATIVQWRGPSGRPSAEQLLASIRSIASRFDGSERRAALRGALRALDAGSPAGGEGAFRTAGAPPTKDWRPEVIEAMGATDDDVAAALDD